MIRTAALTLMALLLAASGAAQQCPQAGPSNWCSGLYHYDGTGNIKAIGADTYLYDALGRLTSGTADVQRTGVASRQTYTYDPFGNRTDVSRDAGSVNCVGGCEIPAAVDAATNHITSNGAHYDEAGNLDFIQATVGNSNYPASYTYDAAGSLAHANSTDNREFIYTADDERIATKNGVSWTWTFRGLDHSVLRQYMSLETNNVPTANLTWLEDYVWRDGALLASVVPATPGSGATRAQHYHLDHLGTPRVVTNASGGVVGIHSYYPFGTELDLSPQEPTTEHLKFTGHERDSLPGGPLTLDNMHARYNMTTFGRFLSPDKHPASASTPQAWNRYSYARNNPIRLIDLDGNKEVEFVIRHFIPAASIQLPHGRNVGDDRTFSLARDASVRTERTIRIETDPSVSQSGRVAVDSPRIGASFNLWTELGGRASGSSMHVDISRIPGWGVLITATQNETEPFTASLGAPQAALFLTGRGGIKSTTNILVSEDGKQINVFGSRSAFPAMEINAEVDQQTFAIYRGAESKIPLGFGIFLTVPIDRECKDRHGNWTCH